jgi:chromosome segregation ATPase
MPDLLDIKTVLGTLEEELQKLKSATELIGETRDAAQKVINALERYNEEWGNLLNEVSRKHTSFLEKNLQSTNDALEKSFNSLIARFTDLSKKVEYSALQGRETLEKVSKHNLESNKMVILEAKKVLDHHSLLVESTKSLIEKIDKADFPTRLDKLDATISGINQGIQNTQSRIDTLERSLKDDLIAKNESLHRASRTNRILIIVTMLFALGAIVVNTLLKCVPKLCG